MHSSPLAPGEIKRRLFTMVKPCLRRHRLQSILNPPPRSLAKVLDSPTVINLHFHDLGDLFQAGLVALLQCRQSRPHPGDRNLKATLLLFQCGDLKLQGTTKVSPVSAQDSPDLAQRQTNEFQSDNGELVHSVPSRAHDTPIVNPHVASEASPATMRTCISQEGVVSRRIRPLRSLSAARKLARMTAGIATGMGPPARHFRGMGVKVPAG